MIHDPIRHQKTVGWAWKNSAGRLELQQLLESGEIVKRGEIGRLRRHPGTWEAARVSPPWSRDFSISWHRYPSREKAAAALLGLLRVPEPFRARLLSEVRAMAEP